ncbi:MarR family winged helix-turn-helix transcriptional regulator [Ignatzschineria sp. LJL83]
MAENKNISDNPLFVSIFQEIFSFLPKVNRISEDLLAEANSEITHSCWVILSIINREKKPLSVPQIADLRSTSRQAVQRQICLLLDYGYIQAVDNPHNKRSYLYETTEKGATYHKNLSEKIYGPWLDDIAEIMGTDGGEQMLASIRQLDDALNQVSKNREPSK